MSTLALRWRRLAAGLLDFTPFILAIGMVLPTTAPKSFEPAVPLSIASPVLVLVLSLLAIHLAADVLSLLVGRPSLADRLARTRVSSVDAVSSA